MLEAARLLVKLKNANTLVVGCWDGNEQGRIGSMQYAASQRAFGAEVRAVFVLDMVGYSASEPDTQRLPGTPDDEALFADLFPDAYDDIVDHELRGDFIEMLFDAPRSVTPRGGLDAANAFVFAAAEHDLRTSVLPLKKSFVELFPETMRSDHTSFWENGYSAVLLTDTGERRNPNFHCQNGSEDSGVRSQLSERQRCTSHPTNAAAKTPYPRPK
jgi:Zn-dependent M28 family amino/carboxypeptidase